jgi:hypothetical protein
MANAWPLALLLLSFPAAAQTCTPGELRVTVKDSQEGPIFGAQVQILSGSEKRADQPTGAEGTADFQHLACGPWTVTANRDGFETNSKSIVMTSRANLQVDIPLELKVQRSNIEVKETVPPVEQSSSQHNELRPAEVKPIPGNPATVGETLPLTPGVVRSPDGELKIDGSGEQRSGLVVNESDVTDPVTGKFGQTVPIDSIETVNVLNTPFLAQYGRFTQSVVAVQTRRGGEKWHADVNDPFPDFRIRSYHMRGIRNETPRGSLGGPLIAQRLYFNTALQYYLNKVPDRTLGFPHNESKQEWLNSFSQLDFMLSPKQLVNATFHFTPQHTNYVRPEFFNPQPVTPTYAQHNYLGTVAHHFALWGGILDSSLAIQRFNGYIGPQGQADMNLTPLGNNGNYFATQNRDAKRNEWLEIWSLAPLRFLGTHLLKFGNSLTASNVEGRFVFRPVNIRNTGGQLLQRIAWLNVGSFNRSDFETTSYVQDHWSITPQFAFDFGGRVEHQKLASSLRIAPRAGLAWTPFANQRTVFRSGYGQFYDHIPLDVYTFNRYPERIITQYAPDGSLLGPPIRYVNVIGSVMGPRSFLINGRRVAGAFSPRGATANVQVEHSFSPLLRVRAGYTYNRSVGLVVVEPDVVGNSHRIVLNGDGASTYRQAEVTAKLAWKRGQQLIITYARSRAEGSLNEFDTFLGNFPTQLVRPNIYSNLAGDLPNRFLTWGHLETHIWNLQLNPIVEYRNGFPYAQLDRLQNYVGVPNSGRFPNFFSADARLMRDFKVNSKYTVRLSVTGFNLSNHFNALAIHNNIADPQYGAFFGNYRRRYRFDFEVLF